MEQLGIKVVPETHNDDSCVSLSDCGNDLDYRNLLHHEIFIKDDPDSDNKCSELIDDTQVMCASTSQSSDGVAMHIKEEPATDVGYDEPAPLLVTQLMDATQTCLIGPCAGYVRLAHIMWPANPAAQQECLHCCNPVYRQTESGLSLRPVPMKAEVEDNVGYLRISSVESVHQQQVVPSGLSSDDVCVSGNSDCTRQVNVKERKCTAGGNTYPCNVCHKGFSRKGCLKSHIRTHTGEKPYKCDICDMSFSQSNNLRSHIRTHTGEKPHKCDICNKRFGDRSTLKKHTRIHTGEKPYKCNMCDMSFNQSISLHDHTRIHTGEKPYKCDTCNKSFATGSYLKKHSRIHTREKPHKCDICNKSFGGTKTLKRHIRTHTRVRRERPHKCDMCNKSFGVIGSLKNHIRTHTVETSYMYM